MSSKPNPAPAARAGQGIDPEAARFAPAGRGEHIRFASAPTPFGVMIVGATARGLCWLSLAAAAAEAKEALRAEFPQAAFNPDPSLQASINAALAQIAGNAPEELATPQVLDLRGTAFQLRVWQALRSIPRGETRTYGQLAKELGNARATRAVARACAMNRVSLLVPCHRVVGTSGSLTGYRWGIDRKRQLLQAETAAAL